MEGEFTFGAPSRREDPSSPQLRPSSFHPLKASAGAQPTWAGPQIRDKPTCIWCRGMFRSVGSGREAKRTRAAGLFFDDDLRGDPFFQKIHMRDHANSLAVLTEGFQCGNRHVQRVGIERAETFIYEKGLNANVAAGNIGQAKGERQAGEKALAARQAFHWPHSSSLMQVFDFQIELLVLAAAESVSVAEAEQMAIGVEDENVQ